MNYTRRPESHVSKSEAANMVGVSEKTLDRRRVEENVLQRALKAGRRLWFPVQDVEAYVRLTRERGYV